MSRIYFHTPEGCDVELHGSERAYMSSIAFNVTTSVLNLHDRPEDVAWIRSRIIDGPDYLYSPRTQNWTRAFETWLRVSWGKGGLLVAGERIGTHELAANTLIATGSPVLAFMAHLHSTCENHAFVEDADAGWAADIVRAGWRNNVLRLHEGWEEVLELLDAVAAGDVLGPVVTSYSVCEGFPNASVADWQAPTCDACKGDGRPNERMRVTDIDYDYCTTCGGEGELHDAWDDLPDDECWRLAEAGMRARAYNRQISPTTLGHGFETGASAFDFAAERWEQLQDERGAKV